MSGRPVDSTQQESLAVYCSIIGSIIERKQAEAKLHESEEQYRKAITAAGAVPYYIDYTTESYRFIGEGIERLIGYKVEEVTPTLLGQLNKETVMTGQGRNLPREKAIQQARAGDLAGWNADYHLVDRSGQTHWLNDSSVQILNEQGNPIGAFGILQDITERKRLEEQIQESLARRSSQVQTSTEVAQEIAAATDLNELFKRVVTLIKERFNYYHAQLFRYDPAQDAVVLIEGYGEVGRKMREALPNAFLFGLTGTPINRADRNTFWAFGADEDPKGYLSRYSFQESIRDRATLPLHFEAPEVKLKIEHLNITPDLLGPALEKLIAAKPQPTKKTIFTTEVPKIRSLPKKFVERARRSVLCLTCLSLLTARLVLTTALARSSSTREI